MIYGGISESLLAIIEIFRIALENCGKKDVKIVSAGTLQRRKSKVPALDVPKVFDLKGKFCYCMLWIFGYFCFGHQSVN